MTIARWPPCETHGEVRSFLGFGPDGPSYRRRRRVGRRLGPRRVRREAPFRRPSRRRPGLAFSPDGRLLASGSNDLTVRVWEVATGAVLKRIDGFVGTVHDVAFSPDGRLLAASDWGGHVRLWRVGTWAELGSADLGADMGVWSTSFSPDGRSLGVCGDAGVVIFRVDVEASNGTERASLRELARPRSREAKYNALPVASVPTGSCSPGSRRESSTSGT